ncbi:MAG: SEC-C metal-binding domain-containing protein, partial [Acidimicrobiia bacterium]|nr:SEC-C metal-binding domain-containing protein [Acidimicrobiia bacterium]
GLRSADFDRHLVDLVATDGPLEFDEVVSDAAAWLAERAPGRDGSAGGDGAAPDVDDGPELDSLELEVELALERNGRLAALPDRRLVDLPTLLTGRIFTHRRPASGDDGPTVVEPGIDLVGLGSDDPEGVVLADGGRVAIVPGPRFEGPQGWLPDIELGQLWSFSVGEDGLVVEPTAPIDAEHNEAHQRALRDTFDDEVGHLPPAERVLDVAALLLQALADDDELFASPALPLGELIDAAGLEARGDWVGVAGEAWESPDEADAATKRHLLDEVYQFSACCHEAYDEIEAAFGRFRDDPAAVPAPSVAEALGHANVAEAFANSVLDPWDDLSEATGEALERFAGAIVEVATGTLVAPAEWLRARGAEEADRVAVAEAALQAAVDADPTHPSACVDLAWFHCDRGDARAARALLRQADAEPAVDELAFLDEMVARHSFPGVGRNDRCPCGSGRKFKTCHATRSQADLADRVDWIQHKAVSFATRPMWRSVLMELVEAYVEVAGDDSERVASFFANPLLVDAALVEGDLFAQFLAMRGELLPADELALGRSWLHETRRLWRVGLVDGDLAALDEVGGDRPRTWIRLAGEAPAVGSALLARPVPDGSEVAPAAAGGPVARHQMVGPVLEIPEHLVEGTVRLVASEPSDVELVGWYAEASQAGPGAPTLAAPG